MTIQAELSADEKVLWTGHADRVPLFVTADLLLVPFTFIWAGGAIAFAVSGATRNPGTLPFAALFAFIGLYISVGRLIVRYRRWRSNEYTLTTERVIVTRH